MNNKVQLEILTKLLKSDEVRYRDLKPEEIENDLFNYHLQFLVKKGLVNKSENYYSLSPEGKRYVFEESPLSPTGRKQDLFKLNVLTIALRQGPKGLEILNQIRLKQPFYGTKNIMGGSIRKGELIVDAAKRKLEIETGLIADFKFLGMIRNIIYSKNNELFGDFLFHICITENTSGELREKTIYGDNFWASIDETIKNEKAKDNSIKSLVTLLETIKSKGYKEIPMFYFENETHLKKM